MNDTTLEVRPAKNRAPWQRALHGRDTTLLEGLMGDTPAGEALAEIAGHVNGLYRSRQKLGFSYLDPEVRAQIERVVPFLHQIRRAAGWQQRTLDLNLLRWIRRSSALSAVIGAGVTVDAGGPSWPKLVELLMEYALAHGHEIRQMEPVPEESKDGQKTFRARVVEVKRFESGPEKEARAVLEKVRQGSADTDTLMQGVELCYGLFGQHLFTHVSELLYANQRGPGPIHRAIAALAHPQHVRDRGGEFPGWDAIITYNFDDFMGQALDDEGLARAAWAMRAKDNDNASARAASATPDIELAGDPNQRAKEAGKNGVYQRVYHLHGYVPNPHLRPFLITRVRFVFATSQYASTYADRSRIFHEVFDGYLANPVHYALYVGCSFQDEAMNELLRRAAQALPGRWHYALLKWPGSMPYAEANADEIERQAARYVAFGVQPIWFENFSEIPALIGGLK